MARSNGNHASSETGEAHRVTVEVSPKRVRLMLNGKTIADSLSTALVLEAGQMPVYYFPREDVRLDLMVPSRHHTRCPIKGDASYWTIAVGHQRIENAAWSYDEPRPAAERIRGLIAFEWDAMSHRFEEDEEVFGHPRDPYHRIDIRASTREIHVAFAGKTIARTHRGLFLFETGLPTRYYIPPDDVCVDFLVDTPRQSVCPYKGQASYFSIQVADKIAEDAAWSYPHPLPECLRIKDHLCFYPEKIDRLDVEGDAGQT